MQQRMRLTEFHQKWFFQVGLVGGQNSALHAIAADATSYPHRDSLFIIQFYAYSKDSKPPFPSSGLTFLDGE